MHREFFAVINERGRLITDYWLKDHNPDAVTPRRTNCRMAKDLPASTTRRWYVFQTEWGGQILMTIPVEMVPKWVDRRRLRRALRLANTCPVEEREEGMSVFIVEDFNYYPGLLSEDAPREEHRLRFEVTCPWIARQESCFPLGLTLACVPDEPIEEKTRLEGWEIVGWVDGGMGGGRLLSNDLWIHYDLFFRGADRINEIRRLLGLSPLTSLKFQMDEKDRWHASLLAQALP